MRLLFTDTDSLMLEIFWEDNIYEIMQENKDAFDFNNFPFVHDNYLAANKRVSGKFKDECAGVLIAKWRGLRAKHYCRGLIGKVKDNIWTKVGEFVDKKTFKIQEAVKNAMLAHEDYKECITTVEHIMAEICAFRSQNHVVTTVNQVKVALSFFDDKRYLLDDGITSVPCGFQG